MFWGFLEGVLWGSLGAGLGSPCGLFQGALRADFGGPWRLFQWVSECFGDFWGLFQGSLEAVL